MSLSAKLDEVVTTDTLRAIGDATVKAFGDVKDLAAAGVQETVNYVWWNAVSELAAHGLFTAAVIVVYIAALVIVRRIGDKDAKLIVLIVGGFVVLFLSIPTLVSIADNAPIIANPQGYMIYTAVKGGRP